MKKHKKELSLPLLLLIGAGVSLLCVVAVSLVFSLIASFTKNPTSLIGIFSLVSLLCAGAVSGFTLSKLIPDGGALIAALSTVIASLLMSVIGLIVKGGSVPFSVFLNYPTYVGISSLFAAIASRRRKRKLKFR